MFYLSFCQKKFCEFRERKYISVGDKVFRERQNRLENIKIAE